MIMTNVEIRPYSAIFAKKYSRIKNKILKAVGRNLDIHHVGSTAVPGLGGKGIIDVLIGIRSWNETNEIVNKLKSIGFVHVHPKENGRKFLSTKRESALGDYHIHIVHKKTKQYEDFLKFVDVLRKSKEEKEKYLEMKKVLSEKYKDRKKYRKLKGAYIKTILRHAKKK